MKIIFVCLNLKLKWFIYLYIRKGQSSVHNYHIQSVLEKIMTGELVIWIRWINDAYYWSHNRTSDYTRMVSKYLVLVAFIEWLQKQYFWTTILRVYCIKKSMTTIRTFFNNTIPINTCELVDQYNYTYYNSGNLFPCPHGIFEWRSFLSSRRQNNLQLNLQFTFWLIQVVFNKITIQ